MARHLCANCGKPYPGWATYEIPKGAGFIFPGRGKQIRQGDKVCGSCVMHAKDTGAITAAKYNKIAANPVDKE